MFILEKIVSNNHGIMKFTLLSASLALVASAIAIPATPVKNAEIADRALIAKRAAITDVSQFIISLWFFSFVSAELLHYHKSSHSLRLVPRGMEVPTEEPPAARVEVPLQFLHTLSSQLLLLPMILPASSLL